MRPRRPKGVLEVLLYSFFNLSARWGWVVNAMPLQLYCRERPGTQYIGGWVDPTASLDTENLTPTGVRSPDRQAHTRVATPIKLSWPTHATCIYSAQFYITITISNAHSDKSASVVPCVLHPLLSGFHQAVMHQEQPEPLHLSETLWWL